MGEAGPRPIVLDAGALIAFEKQDRFARSLLRQAVEARRDLIVPAPVLAQVWRDPRRQARLAYVMALEVTIVDPLDADMARVVGAVCARSGTSDIVDASVVVSAGVHDGVVATSDAPDLRRIDPSLDVVAL